LGFCALRAAWRGPSSTTTSGARSPHRSRASATAGRAALPGSPIYHHALTAGVQAALSIGAAASVLALIVTLVAIRVRREDLPDSPLPA
jgi:hypothetical protein